MTCECRLRSVLLSILAALAIVPQATGQGNADRGVVMLTDYFDLLISGNLESAQQFWTESSLERSARFGISFESIPLKVDASSPIVRDIDFMRDYLQPPVKSVAELPGGEYFRLEYQSIVKGQKIQHLYFAYFDGQYYWLTYPQEYYAQGWQVLETEYLRIHVHPDISRGLNKVALEEADRFIEKMVGELDLSKDAKQALKNKKIEYYYCRDDQVVKEFTGRLVKGMLDLASNDIITSFFPHYHELVHLLTNIKMQRLPLYTQPLVREGIAVHYGGRWGKAPAALADLGAFLYREDIVELDSLLTMAGFQENSASDIAYPVAGLFCGWLLEKIGRDGLLQLYRDLSGRFERIDSMALPTVRPILTRSTGVGNWDDLLADFDRYINDRATKGRVAVPGGLGKGKEVVRREQFVVTANDEWLSFEFTGKAGTDPTGNILFGIDSRLTPTSSLMFDEQYGSKYVYEGHRWGMRFDRNEAGLYDYATGHLVAKYIWGITPSDDYYQADSNIVRICFKRDLIGKSWAEPNDVILLPE
ncbi:MAG: hypothetical protein ACE5FH_02210 [Candidatus Zixiibacteriota bacterium]